LAITRGLVQELNGELHLESKKGQGSKFSVSLPIKQAESSSDTDKTAVRDAYDFTNLNVLMVDDDPIQLTMASEMLNLKGAHVVTETNPENGLKLVVKNRFDIIFVDVQMPNISGYELAEMIRESGIAYCQNVPIIILSATTPSEQLSGDESYTDYLTKPFTSDAFYEIIRKYAALTCRKSESAQRLSKQSGKNVEKLIDFVREDRQASSDILSAFVEETTANIGQLQKALENNDAQTAAALAHKMLPVFQMIGDECVVKILVAMEKRQKLPQADTDRAFYLIRNYLSEAEGLKKQ